MQGPDTPFAQPNEGSEDPSERTDHKEDAQRFPSQATDDVTPEMSRQRRSQGIGRGVKDRPPSSPQRETESTGLHQHVRQNENVADHQTLPPLGPLQRKVNDRYENHARHAGVAGENVADPRYGEIESQATENQHSCRENSKRSVQAMLPVCGVDWMR
jgi:hypothetical protein